MKILHISTNYKPVGDLVGHGGVERLIYWLARQQQKAGRYVEVVGMPGGELSCDQAVFPADIQAIKARSMAQYDKLCDEAMKQISDMIEEKKFDVIHDHMGLFLKSPRSQAFQKQRKILGVYGQVDNTIYREIYESVPSMRSALENFVVTVASDAHKNDFKKFFDADYALYYGTRVMPFVNKATSNYSLSWGTVCDQKEQAFMCEFANTTRNKIIFAGPAIKDNPNDLDACSKFFSIVEDTRILEEMSFEEAKNAVGDFLKSDKASLYVGEILSESLREFLFTGARHMLLLNSTDEPFSLTILEALSCGLNVIAGPFDSAYEALPNTDFIIKSLTFDEMERVFSLAPLSSAEILKFHETRFSLERWEQDVFDIYKVSK